MPTSNQRELTDGEAVHMRHVMKHGTPTIQRAYELKQATERTILTANGAGVDDKDAMDLLSIIQEWIMIRSDKRMMDAVSKIALADLSTAKSFAAKGAKA
jgi:hypothetical protein